MFTAPVLALLIAAQGDAHTLQWKLKEGEVFYNKATVTMDQKIEVLGQKVEQKMGIKSVLKFKVKSVKAGETVVEMTYVEMTVDAPNLPGANAAGNLKGVTFTATLNDKMEVAKLDGYEKFLDAVVGEGAAERKMMKAMMPQAAVKQMFSQTFLAGPAKPVAVGGTWDRTTAVAMGAMGNVETKEKFTLDAVKGDLATLTAKGDLTFKPGDDNGDSGLPFKITKADLKADKYAATHKFDIKNGRVTESKVDMDLSGTMSIEAMGQTIDAKLTMKMKTIGVITDKNPVVD
ncbi:Uncharacterized protein OS=Chthoniobacter flavus Ellin428 GN=CfE428DRAFT_2877 PE=4 SV=1 [Gemmataceae bacterium]|nr:Uncharacterized protein OS=Chthoniobacter flavus Ellin428 GN=CfE428DRAFT_2877 PE=4 SV=1 [Gemmataceae bacterium]VTT96415.1 Uncharacterized protein OS=Chthoniobacter flavus Ellin428 GN=CfE428DRAFT_2877 PE=4 SV=1 [Gemmataceae bacterium]